MDLDADPTEFEALAPRLRDLGGHKVPVLQIADDLVNGSGFCRKLLDDDGAYLKGMVRSILDDRTAWPLNAMLAGTNDDVVAHSEACNQSCYRCIQRYGNRHLHGLLDWRYGMSFLRLVFDPNHRCGLEGPDVPELEGWHATLARDLAGLASFFDAVEDGPKTSDGRPTLDVEMTGRRHRQPARHHRWES